MRPIVLIDDPAVTNIPVTEAGEPLVDLRDAGLMVFSDRKRESNPRLSLARKGVADRLEQAGRALPPGIRFLVVEAFRPPTLQRHYYDHYRERLASEHPDATGDELAALAARFVSPPEFAPHPTGAAIDLTLCDETGRELDLGCPLDATPEESDGACFTDAAGLSADASANRRLLVTTLTSAGLVNYPTEWWHWSYGDRYWAMTTGAACAVYGLVSLE